MVEKIPTTNKNMINENINENNELDTMQDISTSQSDITNNLNNGSDATKNGRANSLEEDNYRNQNIKTEFEPNVLKNENGFNKTRKVNKDFDDFLHDKNIEHSSLINKSANSKENSDFMKIDSHEGDIVSKIIDDIGMTNYQLKLILFGIFISFSYGSEIVVVSLITRKLEKIWHLTDMKKASLGGALFYGFLFGAMFSGKIMSKGRRISFIIGSLIFLFFGMASSFSNEFYSFMFYRIGVGLGLGLLIPTTITFISEMSPSKFRGFNSIIIWIGFPMGELFMCLIARIFPLDNKHTQQSNWTVVIMFASLPIILNLIMVNFIYESPRLTFTKQDFEEGFTSLEKIRKDADLEPLSVSERYEIESHYKRADLMNQETKKNSSLGILFGAKQIGITIKMIILIFIISFMFFALLYIIPELIGKTAENVNFHDLIRTIVYATVFETFGMLLSFIMEIKTIGRIGAFRISLFICFLFSGLCLTNDAHQSFYMYVLKGSIVVANRVLFTYLPETYPTEVRGDALGFAQSLTKMMGVICPIICQILIGISTFSLFLTMGSLCFIGFIVSLCLTKETLGMKID